MENVDVCARATTKYPNGRTGTEAGYQAHRNAGEPACVTCRTAYADLRRKQYVPTGTPKGRRRVSPERRREVSRAASKRWQEANPERYRELQRKSEENRDPEKRRANGRRTQQRRSELIAELKRKPCADCGIQYPPYVMQFDHRDPSAKLFSIGKVKTRSWDSIVAEVEKCDVVCANCHMERTHGPKLI